MVQYTLWGTTVDLEISKDVFPTDDEIKKIDNLLVNCDHGFFETSRGTKLHYRKITPANTAVAKGICVFEHGIQGYAGLGCELDGDLYKHPVLFNHLSEAGYITYALDIQGHGFSEGERFYIPDSEYKHNRDDLASFALHVSKLEEDTLSSGDGSDTGSGSLPLFLAGESYGACLAIHVARQWMDKPESGPSNFQGFCVIAPAIVGDLPAAPVITLLTALAKIYPTWIPFFMPNTIDSSRIWSIEKVRKEFTSDRRKEMRLSAGGQKFCLGTALALVTALEDVRKDVIPGLNIPFFVCHGTNDYGVPISGSEYLIEHSVTEEKDVGVNFVQDEYHDLLSEKSRKEVVISMIDWMNSRIEK